MKPQTIFRLSLLCGCGMLLKALSDYYVQPHYGMIAATEASDLFFAVALFWIARIYKRKIQS